MALPPTRLSGAFLRSGSVPPIVLSGGVISSSTQLATALPGGTVSSSGQIDYNSIQNKLSGVVSSSTQVTPLLPTGTVSSSGQIDYNSITNKLSGVVSSSTQVAPLLPNGSVSSSTQYPGWVTSSAQIDYDNIQNKLSGAVSSSTQVAPLLPNGSVSSSAQVVWSSVNYNTGIVSSSAQTVSNIAGQTIAPAIINATGAISGASIQASGNGTIGGNLTVTGTLTAASQSIQYISSSQFNVATNKIIVNTDNSLRFGGISVVDSGSVGKSGSLYWDSVNDRWLYEDVADGTYTSAIIVAGPQNTGATGTERGLLTGRIPVASGDDHIDTAAASSSIRVDFPSRLTQIEAGVFITGALTANGTVTLAGIPSSSAQVTALLPTGVVSSSAQYPGWMTSSAQVVWSSVNYNSGILSSSTQFNALTGTSASYATTASYALTSAGGGGGGGTAVFVTASDPTLTVNPTSTGSLWLNSSSGQLFVNSNTTANNNEWVNLSTGSNVSPGNTFYSYVTASVLKIVSGTTLPLFVQLKDRFNKSLNINTGQTVVITGSDGTYVSTVYSASGIFTSSVTGPNKITGSFTVSGSLGGTLLTPITITIVDPSSLYALGQILTGSSASGSGGPQKVSTLVTWDSASTNGTNTLANTVDGTLYAWGTNPNLLGGGTTTASATTAIRVGTGSFSSSVWVQHSIGQNHAAAIRNDGTLWTWGDNHSGSLGLSISSSNIPIQVGTDTNWVAVSCGLNYTLALKNDTTLWGAGANNFGQLGVGDFNDKSTFTQVFGNNFSPRIFAGGLNTSYAIKNNGTLFAWGSRGTGFFATNASAIPDGIASSGAVTASKYPSQETSGSTNWVTVIPPRLNDNVPFLTASTRYSPGNYWRLDTDRTEDICVFGVTANNRLYQWGNVTYLNGNNVQITGVANGGTNTISVIYTGSASPRIDNFITASANIHRVKGLIYEIDSTGSLNVFGFVSGADTTNPDGPTTGSRPPEALGLYGGYGATMPDYGAASYVFDEQRFNWISVGLANHDLGGTAGITKVNFDRKKYRASSFYNWKRFPKVTAWSAGTSASLFILGKISGSSYPSASGAPGSPAFYYYTGSSAPYTNPQLAYITFTNTLDDAEIQISGSYPNATGSQFVTYIAPSSSRAYVAPPSYSVNIRYDLRYIKNGIPSLTTSSVTANYCQGNGVVASFTCTNGQVISSSANGACGFTTTNGGCSYSVCYDQYTSQGSGPCTNYGYNGGTYYYSYNPTSGCSSDIDFGNCYY